MENDWMHPASNLSDEEVREKYLRPWHDAAVDRFERAYACTIDPDGTVHPYDPVAWAAAHAEA